MADVDPNAPPNPDPNAPKYVTAEEIGNIVNSAITAHEKRNATKRNEELKTLIGEAVKGIAPPTPPAPGPGNGTDPGKAETPEMAALRAKLAEVEGKVAKGNELVEAERNARKAAEDKARDDRAFNDFKSALAKGGVRTEMLDMVAEHQFYAKKRVTFDEAGVPLLQVRRSPGAGMAEEDVNMPLADGVAFLLKTKEANHWLPPPNGGGGNGGGGNSGGQRNGRPTIKTYDKPAGSEEEMARRAMEREQQLRDRQ